MWNRYSFSFYCLVYRYDVDIMLRILALITRALVTFRVCQQVQSWKITWEFAIYINVAREDVNLSSSSLLSQFHESSNRTCLRTGMEMNLYAKVYVQMLKKLDTNANQAISDSKKTLPQDNLLNLRSISQWQPWHSSPYDRMRKSLAYVHNKLKNSNSAQESHPPALRLSSQATHACNYSIYFHDLSQSPA